ncbi:glycosyltransferase family 39 protein [Streptomyces filipinensis]|uniref:glycosyltransferase family 39 protein n=1 Tax=Streptomyces filipinensis TaxID=66887 RepID=UPI001E5225D9|nr:glycosyltransferase family 39 protein [Streptomyces filipinensis]
MIEDRLEQVFAGSGCRGSVAVLDIHGPGRMALGDAEVSLRDVAAPSLRARRVTSATAGHMAAALVADAAFLVTPVAVGLFRTAVEDPAFTLCVLLAAEATQRAAAGGRLRTLVVAGVWGGAGFQAKMLEAWAVLPALALVYLVSAPITLRKRLTHLAVSAVVMTAVST